MLHILTLNWNGFNKLEQLQPGLFSNLEKLPCEWKWYIRDNGSQDGSKEWIKKQENTVLLDISHNRDNFSQGVNSLFDLANPAENDLLLLLNNDIIFNDDQSLLNMYNLMKSTESHITGCKLNYSNGLISHAGIIFSSNYGNMPWNYRSGEKENSKDKKNRYFQAVTAACSLVTVKSFKEAGKLDTNLSWAFEDVAFNLYVSKILKYKISYCGQTNITHLTSASLNINPVNKLFLPQNVKYFKEKWFGKYDIDHSKYLNNNNFNLIKG